MNEPYYEEVQDFYTSDPKKPALKEVNVWPCTGRSSSSSGVSFSCPHVLLYLSLLCLISCLLAHPQCLDYGPPFQPPFHLEFCSAYENFGCCDQERDNSIAAKYWDIMDYIDPRGLKMCGTYIKDILCQECSPYAAHLYDAENPRTPLRNIPGLCFDYCSEFHFNCHSAISLLTSDRHIQECCETNRTRFCNLLRLHDEDYCFPNVLKSTALNTNLGSVVEDHKGCLQLCLTEVANGLRNPVLMVHANDHTHRMFIAEQVGVIWVYLPDGSWLEEPFLDVRSLVLATPWLGDERGFLGMAFHPKYKDNGKFYIYYSYMDKNRVEKIRISELKVLASDANKADPRSERNLLELEEPAANHNGGQLLFGVDGYMYLFTGDGGKAGDPFGTFGNAQNTRLMALQEDETRNKWKKQDICIGSTRTCAFPRMISSYSKFIISFAEDEAGELYFLSTSYPSAYAPHGSLYRFIDPARRAPPGKCKYKPIPVKTKGKWIPFVPRAKTVLELLNEPSTTKPLKKSSTPTAATPAAAPQKGKKTPSTKIKASTAKSALSGKKRQKIKAEVKPHKPKQKKVAHVDRTTSAPPSPKKSSSHLTRTQKLLPQKAAFAKEKWERGKERRLRSSS
ncbi:HHIP-like protein 2 isoform X3 [Pezoporus occidentalis]|uniref:HHIP-like protein 2 isoform X3 n=1 Tax=Pezoporus occidentalis TaxID=407982 RepID=UPI002F906F46